jgi:hypothetical protein
MAREGRGCVGGAGAGTPDGGAEAGRGEGRGGPTGQGSQSGGASASQYGAVPAARARCSVLRRRRARLARERVSKEREGLAWPVGLSHRPGLTPIGQTPSRLELS